MTMFCSVVTRLCWLLIYCCMILPSDGLQRNGENVCVKQRLVKVLDVYPSSWQEDWDCELHYPNITCGRIRSGDVNIDSVHFLEESLTCCPGWVRSEDVSCTIPCEEGYFGENCEFECRCINSQPGCDPIDGSCDCLDGWTGSRCDQRCRSGIYGPNCTLTSVFSCENGGTNHPVTGECLCPFGYEGLACEIDCPSGTACGHVSCGQCIAHSLSHCDTTFSSCICKHGWQGRYCTDLCPLGFGGDFCSKECCSPNGRCFGDPTEEDSREEDSTECSCNDGYYGEECEDTCPDGTFGRNCEQECQCPSCDAVTGICENCPSGFKGPQCLERCSASEWGPSCLSGCSCSAGEACDVFSGKCSTNPTWLIVCLLVLLLIAVLVATSYLCYRRREKEKEEQQNGEVQTVNEVDGYSTWGSTWDRATQSGFKGGVHDNGSTAQHPVQFPVSKHRQARPIGNHTHNPLYGREERRSAVHGKDGIADGEFTQDHVYATPGKMPQDPFDDQPPGDLIYEYDYLKTDQTTYSDPEAVGPVYHPLYK